jgi:hypothetical protein
MFNIRGHQANDYDQVPQNELLCKNLGDQQIRHLYSFNTSFHRCSECYPQTGIPRCST